MVEQYVAVGRRKTAVARVYLRPGRGKIEINGKTPEDFFGKRANYNEIIQSPFKETDTLTKFDVTITVDGGGITGQVEAIRMGTARALQKANPAYRPVLKSMGFLTRDAREKERRKYGLAKARKRYQYSKR
jgi:small subunit ribosomal protein S9